MKTFISVLLILFFESTKVESLDIIEEILMEIKQINQKVDLLNEKADDNHKIIETMQEEVRKNFTNLESRNEMTGNDITIVKRDFLERLNSMQNDMKAIKENTKKNFEILKNEIPAVKENFLTLNSNIGKIEQGVITTKAEVKTSSDKIFNKVEPIRDEMIRRFESSEYQLEALNHTIDEKYANFTKGSLQKRVPIR